MEVLEYDDLPTSPSTGDKIAALALDPAYSSSDFMGILSQLKGDNIEALATETRYNLEVRVALMSEYPPSATTIRRIPCKVDPNPSRGSFNLVFFIDFDDGKSWVLKLPANGHPRCWDDFAAGALQSEAFTMRWIREKTTIPVPGVYGFDTSMDNALGCPYIMMECIQGKSLYHGWFNPQASPARLEQFRARALQGIAAAMVQLHNFRFHTSGSLRFGVNGVPYGFQSAKVVDFLGTAARPQDDPSMDAMFAKKGPFKDPMEFLLFNLNRRESMYDENAGVRGLHESLRLFTQWTLEPVSGGPFPFVLGHPDFDLQNILVKEDGTLCGILDWDGVSAVPHTVGCLKYPLWLTRDWEPSNYNYDAAKQGKKSETGRWENSPEENECYRVMYAQFIETELSHRGMDGRFEKITRLSLLAGVLESADTVPEFLYETIQNLYGKIGKAVGEEPCELDAGFGSPEEANDGEEEEEWQEAVESHEKDGSKPTEHVRDSEEEKEANEGQEIPEVQGEDSTEPTELDPAITGQGEEVKPQVDCKKCKAAQLLESLKTEDEPPMLDAIRNPLYPGGIPRHPSNGAETVPDLYDEEDENSGRTMQGSDSLKSRGANLLSWMAHKVREAAEVFYVNPDGHAETEQRRREMSTTDLARARAISDAKVDISSMTINPELEHSKDCPRNKKPMRPSTPETEDSSAIVSSGDVWARIGRRVQNWGVPSAMIEEHEADIAELIVQTMKEKQNKAEKLKKVNASKSADAVYETERYAGNTVAESIKESAPGQSNETIARKLKETLGIGPPLAEAHPIRKFKPVDMEIAKLDPAIIAAKKSDNRNPVVPNIYTNTPAVGATKPEKRTALERSRMLAVPEGYDKKRRGVVEGPEVEIHTVQTQRNGFVNTKGPPWIRVQGRAIEDTQIEGGKGNPQYIINPYEHKDVHKKGRGKGNELGNTSVSRNGTRGSNTPSRPKASEPLKDGHGDKALIDDDISDGGVPLGTKKASGGKMVMDDLRRMNENEPSREEIGHACDQPLPTVENNALSVDEGYVCVDKGGFNFNDICVGLGDDTLDEEQFDRLRTGFMQVLESTLGLI